MQFLVEVVVELRTAEELAEKDKLNVLVQLEANFGGDPLDAAELCHEFLNQEGHGQFVAEGSRVLGGQEHRSAHLLLHYHLPLHRVKPRELHNLVKFC
jgi:hypothetical protein